ncbi:MAG: ABC transporter ATP-binding protein [Phycisphaerales bacterium]|nr:ABC transporter ATP-binding protein [Phycisphaerales bacterium]
MLKRSDPFWFFAKRMCRRRKLFAGTLVFSILSAGGLAAGLITIGPVLELILVKGASLQSAARSWLTEHAWTQQFVSDPIAVTAWIPIDPFNGVVLLMGALCVMSLLGGVANYLHQSCSLTLSAVTVAEIRLIVFRHAIHLPLEPVLRRGPAEIVSRISRDTAELERGFTALTSKALAQLTKGLAAFAAALYFDWRLTIAAIIVAPLLAVIMRKIGKRIRRSTKLALEQQEDILRVSQEAISGLRGFKTATAEATAFRRFARASRALLDAELTARFARAFSVPIVEVLTIVVIMGLALIAANEILAGRMSFERFILSLGALGVAGGSLRPLTGLLNDIQSASAPAQRLLEIFAIPVEGMRERDLPALPRHARSIEFEAVRFRYLDADRDALRDIQLTIQHGEFIAFVGPNGCGKTTLASLLCRLFDPMEGSILIDRTDIRAGNLQSLRRQVGVVAQESTFIRGTIRENVMLGADDVDADALDRALQLAHAKGFVSQLSKGLDSMIGEGGTGLSGGQKQRLAIARALLRDPAILVLDEATSQIDAESEAQIAQAIEEFCVGRTVIAIAHRLSTVRRADRIVVMEEGRIIDVGTHEALLKRCGLYERLARTQFITHD